MVAHTFNTRLVDLTSAKSVKALTTTTDAVSNKEANTHVCIISNRHVLNLGPHNGLDSDGSNRQMKTNTPLLVGLCIPQANLIEAFSQPLQESPANAVSAGCSEDLFPGS